MNCPNSKRPIWPSAHRRERGAVLIMALLIVALVAGLGIKFAGDYQLGLARAEGRWHGAQARAYTYAAEGAVIKILEKDDEKFDAPDEPWALEMPIEVEGGELLVRVQDASGFFDLNSLFSQKPFDPAKSQTDPTRYTPPQRIFIRFLQTFPEFVRSTDEAIGILEAIVDWMDADNNPSGSYGAEQDYYLSLPDPYMPANMPFRSIEELRLVRGIKPELMKIIRPYLTVMAPGQNQGMNVNTMEPRFYRCINRRDTLTPLDEQQANALQHDMPSSGHYTQLSEFDVTLSHIFGSGGDVDKEGFAVNTQFFWLTTRAQIGEQRRTGRSLLQRGKPQFKVVRREEIY